MSTKVRGAYVLLPSVFNLALGVGRPARAAAVGVDGAHHGLCHRPPIDIGERLEAVGGVGSVMTQPAGKGFASGHSLNIERDQVATNDNCRALAAFCVGYRHAALRSSRYTMITACAIYTMIRAELVALRMPRAWIRRQF